MLKPSDFNTIESYKNAIRQEASRLTSGPRTKFWVYRNVEMLGSNGSKQTVAVFFVLGDDRAAQSIIRGKPLICSGMCGLDSGRIFFIPERGIVPFSLLKGSVPALLGKTLHMPPEDGDAPPDYSRVDIDKLKRIAIESWSACRLVKVVSARKGPLSTVDGYITLEKYLLGCDCGEMARRLGLPSSSLYEGAYVMRLKRPPAPAEFELRGYTNTPQGKTYKPGGKSDYPPGSAIPQWKLIRAVPAEAIRSSDGRPKLFRQGERYKP
jgi:hypothetical protein